jgi:hypothetical protein
MSSPDGEVAQIHACLFIFFGSMDACELLLLMVMVMVTVMVMMVSRELEVADFI